MPGYVEHLERLVTGAGTGTDQVVRRAPSASRRLDRWIVNLVMGRVG